MAKLAEQAVLSSTVADAPPSVATETPTVNTSDVPPTTLASPTYSTTSSSQYSAIPADMTTNYAYLRHVILKYLSDDMRRPQLLPVIGQMLRFTKDEMNLIKEAKDIPPPSRFAGFGAALGWGS